MNINKSFKGVTLRGVSFGAKSTQLDEDRIRMKALRKVDLRNTNADDSVRLCGRM